MLFFKAFQIRVIVVTLLCLFATGMLLARTAEVTYRIVEFDSDTQNFVLCGSGEQPEGSFASFWNEFGATRGNRYNQIPRNCEASFYLSGWQGCTLQSIKLSLCSNNKAGTLGLDLLDDGASLYHESPTDFADPTWFGQWVSKDHGIYVEVERSFTFAPLASDLLTVTLKGGTREGSVYVHDLTLTYDIPEEQATESPLGWVFQKLEKKSTLSEEDVLMIYRSGFAAADLDGMQTSHYLDAIALTSTAEVNDPDVLLFRLSHPASAPESWTITDQYGRQLGATASDALAWDDGVLTWNITLGYDGATIASTNSKYGTLRFNAPEASYPRFRNYTSQSLPLPYLYRRDHQQTPILSTSIDLGAGARTVSLSQDTVVVRARILPERTTDQRLLWQSSNPAVASVRSGIVQLHTWGETDITVTSHDGNATASFHLTVVEDASGIDALPAGSPSQDSPAGHRSSLRPLGFTLTGQPLYTLPSSGLFLRSR